jgi:N-methylhydantoinase B
VLGGKAVIKLQPGDLIRLQLAGGGGWGDPRSRAPEAVAEDVKEGKVSLKRAAQIYGWAEHT